MFFRLLFRKRNCPFRLTLIFKKKCLFFQPIHWKHLHREPDQCEDERNTTTAVISQQESNDNHPQLWASAGLSVAAAAAASSVLPRLTMPKKVTICSKRPFTPHSSLDNPDSKHIVSVSCFFFLFFLENIFQRSYAILIVRFLANDSELSFKFEYTCTEIVHVT